MTTRPGARVMPLAAAAVLGAVAAFGQAPYDLPLLLVAGFIMVIRVYDRCQSSIGAALFGWAVGTGYFMHALHWIVSPFMVDASRYGWMAPFALVFLAAGLALFWGLAFWLSWRISPKAGWPLILTLPAAELVRAYIFTGFPWAMPAQSLVGVLPGQMMAVIGPHALNLLIVAVAAAGAFALRPNAALAPRLGWGIGVGFSLILTAMPVLRAPAPLTDYVLRLVQPNAAQRDKWNPEKIPVFFDRQLRFTAAPPEPGQPAPDVVIWPESAIPWPLDYAGEALVEIAKAGGAAPVALGAQRRDDRRYYNSMVVLDRGGEVAQQYDKHHLVPFGEYMPFGDLLGRFGIYGLAAQAGNGYSAGSGPKLLDFGPLGTALPLICYEAVFPQDVNAAPARPDFLIQITNDAWFGKGAGPRQHLAQARMRAIEQGLPLARAANTGISAMIDPQGRVISSLPLNQSGFIDAALPAPGRPTPYSRMGDLPFAVLLLLGLGSAGIRARRV